MHSHPTLLVTGASGQLGRQVIQTLLEAGETRLLAGTRKPHKLADLAERGVPTREVDFDRPESLQGAFHGVERLLLISTDALDQPGRRVRQHRAAIDAAVAAGVRHLVYTSLPNPVPQSAALLAPDHHETEQAIRASGLGYTILRNTLYADNLLAALPQIVESGRWLHAAGKGKIALVTRADCARAAAAALASTFEGQRVLNVTGPDLLDRDETSALIAAVSGRPVQAVEVPPAGLVAGMVAAGLPAPFAEVLASFDVAQSMGEYAIRSATVEELTGRAPMPLAEFLAGQFSRR